MKCEICGKRIGGIFIPDFNYEYKDYYKEFTAPDGNKFELLDDRKFYHIKCLKENDKK